MKRIRPWVKKALLVTVIVVAVGAGFSMVAGEHGRDVPGIVKVSQEFHGRPADNMKVEIRGGADAAVPALRGFSEALPALPPTAEIPLLQEGRIRIERGHEYGIGPGVVVGGTILIAGLFLFWVSKRSKRSRAVDGPNALAGIPSASDFLDQWEMQQNQAKESK
ncbi:hypothetical protein [Paenibacillus silvisoli]|uniref:hypothetical protein n=1 Tax=Paenibacillus silvisoli TaxID=3110539 RepID=UPI002805C837|nr:hypothetical protein [Paenibacillus silvisoli]